MVKKPTKKMDEKAFFSSYRTSIKDPNDEDIDSEEDFDQEKKRNENRRYKGDTVARKLLAIWAAGVVSIWLTIVVILLFRQEKLSDSVFIALLGTTTLNILGLMYIVLKGLFNPTARN